MHPSIVSHLDIEYHLLQALYTRSKHQHRTQPFVRRLEQVLRIVRLLRDDWNDLLLQKLVCVLESATRASNSIIQLNHFLPLQMALMGIYGRLFALARGGVAQNVTEPTQPTKPTQLTRPTKPTKPTKPTRSIDDIFSL